MEPSLDTAGPGQGAGDPLAGALLPVLLHRINNVTQLLTSLNSVLALAAGERELGDGVPLSNPRHGAMLLDAATDAEELGWLLGVLGCGLGADLLLSRREPRGLDATVRLVTQTLKRDRAELLLEPADRWPSLTSDVPSHGDLCWLVAYGAWFAARQGGWLRLERPEPGGAHVLRCSGAGAVDWAPLTAVLRERLPGAELENSDEGWCLRLPATWLKYDA